MQRFRIRMLGSFVGISVLAQWCGAASAEDDRYAIEYYRDFQSDGFDNRSLKPFGRGATSLVKESKQGIVVSVPSVADIKVVGIAPRFKVQGDFEITLSYKVLDWSRPKQGSGIGPSIYIASTGKAKAAAEFGRLHGAKRDIYSTFSAANVDGKRKKTARRIAARSTEGQLRLRRRGKLLSFEVGEGSSAAFRVLAEIDYGDEDLRMVRIAVKQSKPKSTARIAFQNLRIRASAFPHLPSAQAPTEKLYRPTYSQPPQDSDWPVVWIATGGTMVVLAVAIWLFRRRRNA